MKPPCSTCGDPTLVKNTGQVLTLIAYTGDVGKVVAERIRCRPCLDGLRLRLIAETRERYGWV